jgi:Flp pilus assembly pilin Flp
MLLSQRGIAVQWLSRTEGQGLVEYSLILLLAAVAVASAVLGYGGGLDTKYREIVSVIPSA